MNLKDPKTNIYPSKTRGGKEPPSSSALDSPSVMIKLATPPHAINPNMLQVIDDATSAMNDAYDDASTLLDKTVPLGEFLDEQLARAKENENAETDEIIETEDFETPIRPSSPTYELSKDTWGVLLWMVRWLGTFLLVRIDMILRNYYESGKKNLWMLECNMILSLLLHLSLLLIRIMNSLSIMS